MKSHFFALLGLTILFFLSLFCFIKLFPSADLHQLIENSLVFSGLIGIAYSIPLAKKELEDLNNANIPKIVHLGVFDFYKEVKIAKFTSLSSTAFNLYGWIVTNEEMKRLIFVSHKDEKGNPMRGDYIHVWLPKFEKGDGEAKEVIVDPNPSKKALNVQDHLVIIYEDGNGRKHFSLMTGNYRYKFGELSHRRIASALKISPKIIQSFELSSRYE